MNEKIRALTYLFYAFCKKDSNIRWIAYIFERDRKPNFLYGSSPINSENTFTAHANGWVVHL